MAGRHNMVNSPSHESTRSLAPRAAALSAALAQKLDLLVLGPRQELGSFAERLILPCDLAAFGLHIAAKFYFRIPFWYGLLFPFGYTVGALMALDSVRRRLWWRVTWKGRIHS
jgi:hypothetical protein